VASSGATPQTHFAAIGGRAAIARLVERFYYHMDTWPGAARIRAWHPLDLALIKGILERYLMQWLGGPALYSEERGHPRLRRRHLTFPIGSAERDAWMYCMRKALSDVVEDAALRAELDAAFNKVADFLRNTAEPPQEPQVSGEPRQ
jgi:hemoglobin